MRKAQLNSEILKWILLIIILAVIIVVIFVLQKGLPETVDAIISKTGEII